MPWAKIDDGACEHRKFKRVGLEATGLYFLCVSYASRWLTDGEVDFDYIKDRVRQPAKRKKLLEALLDNELFEMDDEGRYWIHDYLAHNPDRDQVKKRRGYWARKKSLHRDRALVEAIRSRDGSDCRYCGHRVDWTDRKGPYGGTYDHIDPLGGNEVTNVVVACRRCNSVKSDCTPMEAGMELREIRSGSDPGQNGVGSHV